MMMNRIHLTDEEWLSIYSILKQINGIRVGNQEKTKCFVNAVLWILRIGAQWRNLPKEFGNWNSIFKRFSSWCQKLVWDKLLSSESQSADLQHVSIDSTVNRAHACAAGMKDSNANDEALGRSKGGF